MTFKKRRGSNADCKVAALDYRGELPVAIVHPFLVRGESIPEAVAVAEVAENAKAPDVCLASSNAALLANV
ncbi:hypothetical protein CFAM422_001999 [Trichoderma lentiforme]|uniref:Uncharacterized protein n=1 Tax=Trichoderma lentiforme TaxID=1567552 RepID=A0A9P4XMR9_9HYPO|nr:hypothetical protein CFAM422_001999 [Trichoderma lentiforme]